MPSRRRPRQRFAAAALAALGALGSLVLSGGLVAAGCGRGVTGPHATAPPRRIVSMAPSLTESLFAMGFGDRVVGVDDYSLWPPAAAAKVHLGGMFNPNLERIVALRPDLAVLLPSERDIGVKLERLGIATIIVRAETLADVERSFVTIAARCGDAAAGERAAAAWRTGLAPQPVPGAPRVMLCVDRQAGRLANLLAAAHGTFLDELLTRLGGVNVFADAASRYPQVAMEEVVARAPQVILELRTEAAPPSVVSALIHDWSQLPSVPAVRDRRIEVIAGGYVLVPGPRLPQLYRRMRAALMAAGGAVGALGAADAGAAARDGRAAATDGGAAATDGGAAATAERGHAAAAPMVPAVPAEHP